MKSMKRFSIWIAPLIVALGCATVTSPLAATSQPGGPDKPFKVVKPDAEWKKLLSPGAYDVLRHGGTEAPYKGKNWDNHADGIYVCAGCGNELFSSQTKFESGTGWPSFYRPIAKGHVLEKKDTSLGMERTEVLCAWCGGHLGHVFDDGPKPTGLRYCMNSIAMTFKPAKKN